MAVIRENAIVRHARGTAANFTSENPTLDESEIGYETDTKFLKIGDGSTAWTSLDYQPNPAEVDGKATVSTYSTAWINRSDWTNVHLGSDDTKDADSNLNHGLTANLSDLLVKIFLSTDGTDANSFEITNVDFSQASASNIKFGIRISQVDTANIQLQTGIHGLVSLTDAGDFIIIDAEDWYYKIKVYKLA